MFNFINKHKGLSIVIGLSLVLFIILLVIFISLFFGSGQSLYGNRLEGIEEVELTSTFLNDVQTKLKEDESVIDANVRLQGKIVYIVFEVNSEVSIETAKVMASKTLEDFKEEELSFYDFSYIIKWTKIIEEQEQISAIEGYKHHAKESITWSKS